jgi:hypothetical protein
MCQLFSLIQEEEDNDQNQENTKYQLDDQGN